MNRRQPVSSHLTLLQHTVCLHALITLWLQMQALASGVGTVLGTIVRIPCEVLKQRLQVGHHTTLTALTMGTSHAYIVRCVMLALSQASAGHPLGMR